MYLTLDNRVHWVVCAVVKRWALQNDLKNQSMFTSYALVWLVLFYLMTIGVVPPLKLLRDHAVYSNSSRNQIPDEMFIEGKKNISLKSLTWDHKKLILVLFIVSIF